MKAKPAGHPFGLLVVALQLVPFLEKGFHLELIKVFVGYSVIATALWGFALWRDLLTTRKALLDLRNKPPLQLGHEHITEIGMALRGIGDIYVDLSGVDTKTLVNAKALSIEAAVKSLLEKLIEERGVI